MKLMVDLGPLKTFHSISLLIIEICNVWCQLSWGIQNGTIFFSWDLTIVLWSFTSKKVGDQYESPPMFQSSCWPSDPLDSIVNIFIAIESREGLKHLFSLRCFFEKWISPPIQGNTIEFFVHSQPIPVVVKRYLICLYDYTYPTPPCECIANLISLYTANGW